MSLAKATRKLKRVGKTAVQFRITSTFEFIELQCKGTWRPEKLRVIWLRNHRKVKSNDTTWTVTEDFGPNGAKGRAVFNPAIAVSLVVTLYRDTHHTEFDEKEYKYYVEHEGAGGKKILATFNCNVADFVGIPSTRHALDLNFKCVSKKVKEVKLGITLESQFVKEGGALDDDMQSTFSAMSAGQDSVMYDEEDDDEEGEGQGNGDDTTVQPSPTLSQNRGRLNTLHEEADEIELDVTKSVVLGTGEHVKEIPRSPPPKPPRGDLSTSHIEGEGVLERVDTDTEVAESVAKSDSAGQPLSDVPEAVLPVGNQSDIPLSSVSPPVVSASASQDVSASASQDVSASASQDVSASASQDVSASVSQDINVSASQDVTSQDVSPPVVSLSTPRDVSTSQPPVVNVLEPSDVSVAVRNGGSESKEVPEKMHSGVIKEEPQVMKKAEVVKSVLTSENGPHTNGLANHVPAGEEEGHRNNDAAVKGEGLKNSAVAMEGEGLKGHKVSKLHHEEVTVEEGRLQEVVKEKEQVRVSPEVELVKEAVKPKEVKREAKREAREEVGTENKLKGQEVREGKEERKEEVRPSAKEERKEEVRDTKEEKKEVREAKEEREVKQERKEEVREAKEEKKEEVRKAKEETKEEVRVIEEVNGMAEKVVPESDTAVELTLDPAVGTDEVDAYGRELGGSGYDHVFEMARSLASVTNANSHKSTESNAISSTPNSLRRAVQSNETYTPPPNPYLEEPAGEEAGEATPTKPSPIEAWLDPEARLVDCFNEPVSRERLEQADLIGLYFSAGWCPPCRRFLPKLVKFYHHLKQHGKLFEIIYISSDYSEQDMMKYMKEQQMPWLGISYKGNFSEDFRKNFSVSAVPLLKILTRKGRMLEDSAKKSVEGASSGSSIIKLYNKWHEKLASAESAEEEGRTTASFREKKGLLSKVKATMHHKEKHKDSEQNSEISPSPPRTPESGRRALDTRQARSKSKMTKVTQDMLEEKDDRIHYLEEVNRTLKQTNDEQAEELGELRAKIEVLTAELSQLKSTSKTLQDESKELIANLNMRGWLYKRGVRGPTANKWRRRYFRLDQGSKLYYYKNSSEGTPQGYIDMDKVLAVQEVTSSQQDKNHATFTVQCDGRTFQLQAHDEPNMRKWMEAILYIVSWRKKHAATIGEE